MKVRKSCAEGIFYPKGKAELKKLIEEVHEREKNYIHYNYSEKRIIGGIVPHAKYIYSAPEAIHFFEILKKVEEHYDTVVIISPNHKGQGADIALTSGEYWQCSFGKVEVDQEFQKELKFPIDDKAHKGEHGNEVMLPMLKYYLDYDFKIVPISFKEQNFSNAKHIATMIHEVAEKQDKHVLVIASSDFSHYVEPDRGQKLDDIVLRQIKVFNSEILEKVVKEYNISICGFGPIMVLLEYAKLYHYNPMSAILRRGSGPLEGDLNELVDYITILFYGE